MDNKRKLSKEEIKTLMEEELYTLVESAIEGEYDIDRLDNLVYKEGGRKRATNKIKKLLNKWEQEYDVTQSEMKDILRHSLQSISQTCKSEQNEIMCILSEIEKEEQVEKDIKEGNIEKYERNI